MIGPVGQPPFFHLSSRDQEVLRQLGDDDSPQRREQVTLEHLLQGGDDHGTTHTHRHILTCTGNQREGMHEC